MQGAGLATPLLEVLSLALGTQQGRRVPDGEGELALGQVRRVRDEDLRVGRQLAGVGNALDRGVEARELGRLRQRDAAGPE